MTKNILAIAIAAAVMAPSAFAAATVYGNVHESYNSFSTISDNSGSAATAAVQGTAVTDTTGNVIGYAGAKAAKAAVASNSTGTSGLASNSSYVGIKGDEDLGGGMKAVYQMEFGVSMTGNGASGTDAHTGLGDTRNTFVGVGGGFGTVLAGRHDSLIKLSGRKYDLFGDQLGNNRNALNNGGDATSSFVVDGRHDNVLAYVSPTFSGFHFGVAYVGGNAVNQSGAGAVYDNGTNATKAPAITAIADYEVGNFSVTAGYINISHAADVLTYSASTGASAVSNDVTAMRLGAGYTFGAAKVVALYQNDNISKNTTVSGYNSRDTYGLGGSYKVGSAGTIKAQYYVASNTQTVTGKDSNGGTMTTVGYDHAITKNTTAYAVYAAAHNDAAGTYSVDSANSGSGSNVVALAGKDNSAFSVGLIHKF